MQKAYLLKKWWWEDGIMTLCWEYVWDHNMGAIAPKIFFSREEAEKKAESMYRAIKDHWDDLEKIEVEEFIF
jgi:hypothetical protein